MIPDKIFIRFSFAYWGTRIRKWDSKHFEESTEYIRKDSIKAKPLEWEDYSDRLSESYYATIRYEGKRWIDDKNSYILEINLTEYSETFTSIAEAKAAAQEHYDNFIKSQIA